MIEVFQDLQALLDHVVGLATAHVGHEANSARIVLMGRIV